MTPLSPDVIGALGSIPGIVAGLIAYKKSIKAAKEAAAKESTRFEAGAFDRARRLYESGIGQLEQQVEHLRRQVLEEQEASSRLRREVFELHALVATLRRQLIDAGIEIKPDPNSAF